MESIAMAVIMVVGYVLGFSNGHKKGWQDAYKHFNHEDEDENERSKPRKDKIEQSQSEVKKTVLFILSQWTSCIRRRI